MKISPHRPLPSTPWWTEDEQRPNTSHFSPTKPVFNFRSQQTADHKTSFQLPATATADRKREILEFPSLHSGKFCRMSVNVAKRIRTFQGPILAINPGCRARPLYSYVYGRLGRGKRIGLKRNPGNEMIFPKYYLCLYSYMCSGRHCEKPNQQVCTGYWSAEKRFGVNLRQVFSFIFSLVGQVIFQGGRHSSSKRNTHLHCILISGQP